MQRKFIAKFDYKHGKLRMDFYKAESLRIAGRCESEFNMNSKVSVIRNTIDKILLQADSQFEIGFKKNKIANIRTWMKVNIFKIYIKSDIDDDVAFEILKIVNEKCIIIRD